MSIHKANSLPPVASMGSTGDGSSQAAQVDPITGQRNISYRPPVESSRLTTAGSDQNQGTQRGDDLTSRFRASAALVRGVDRENVNTGYGIAIGGNGTDNFRTTGHADGQEFGTVAGVAQPLIATPNDVPADSGAGESV